jgi:hypothetical protein
MLIKSVLSSLPIFQFSSLLAPIGIKKSLARAIQKLLWQGGKSNTKIFHLENWNLVRAPKDNGKLGVWDPEVMNLSLGAKILWRMVPRKNKWWKKALVKKYMEGNRK